MATLAIVNPVAGRGAGSHIWQKLRTQMAWDWSASERPGHARDLARTAADQGYARVVAVGGDGTVSEVANGLAGSDTALGIIPAGTGFDHHRKVALKPLVEISEEPEPQEEAAPAAAENPLLA